MKLKKTLQDSKANFMGFLEHMVALAVASKIWIMKTPQNGEFLAVVCLCKKDIEIKISNKGMDLKKEDNICSKYFYICDKNSGK